MTRKIYVLKHFYINDELYFNEQKLQGAINEGKKYSTKRQKYWLAASHFLEYFFAILFYILIILMIRIVIFIVFIIILILLLLPLLQSPPFEFPSNIDE